MRLPRAIGLLLFSTVLSGALARAAGAAPSSAAERGQKLFLEKCAMCHLANGAGIPPVYPPLAGSDWLSGDRARLIRVLCEGLSGRITVNGVDYTGLMPAQVLDDSDVADVLTFVGGAWGNRAKPFEADEVKAARTGSRFPTFATLVRASAYPPLPAAPPGWKVREVVRLPEFATRIVHTRGRRDAFVLAQKGAIYRLDLATDGFERVLQATDYLHPERGGLDALGLAQGADGRLWIVTNQRRDDAPAYVMNEVVIHRSGVTPDGSPTPPAPWFSVQYPFGIGPYNHGASHLAFGPDGLLYVSSGARTDGGEQGNGGRFFGGGETEITACLWRFDPKSERPQIEVFARGLRNAFGFAWDDAQRLFSVSNGPDASTPEEMDFLERGRHYGFPYQFADLPVRPRSPYPHTPRPPAGLEFTPPVRNLGPAGGGRDDAPLATFDPHSSPAGMIWCGEEFPAPLRGSFLIARFGNLLGGKVCPEDVGFDLLSCHLERQPDGTWCARTETILAPLGRPIDVAALPGGRVLLLEYTRPTSFKSQLGWLPGRILELAPEKSP